MPARSVTLTPDMLARGAGEALRQCGILLRDAVLLFDGGSIVTAAGLALLAREELGRYKLLRKFLADALKGAAPTERQVARDCEDHAKKQEAAQLSIAIRPDNESALGKLLPTKLTSPLGTAAYRDADAALGECAERLRKRQPQQRHRRRMAYFYVDVAGGNCSIPANTEPVQCLYDIADAVNDYAGARDRLAYSASEDESTISELIARTVELPQPRWPANDAAVAVLERLKKTPPSERGQE